MLFAVLGAATCLGVGMSFVSRFLTDRFKGTLLLTIYVFAYTSTRFVVLRFWFLNSLSSLNFIIILLFFFYWLVMSCYRL